MREHRSFDHRRQIKGADVRLEGHKDARTHGATLTGELEGAISSTDGGGLRGGVHVVVDRQGLLEHSHQLAPLPTDPLSLKVVVHDESYMISQSTHNNPNNNNNP